MNTNMAEGAAQRLVAEMAQILFGQPGLTLMELAEKVKTTQPSLPNTADARDQFKAWWDSARPLEHRTFHFEIAWAAWQAALAARQPVAEQHPDDLAVDAFAAAMKAKMAAARAKGRSGWEDPAQCSADDLSLMLRDHVDKGDPRDVANFCMMLHLRGEAIAGRQPVGATVKDSLTVRGGQQPVGYLFTDDPAVYAMPGSGFHAGSQPPKDAINVVPVYAAPPAQAVDLAVGDMFWLADDPERFGHSVDELIDDCEIGDEIEIQTAVRLPNFWVRVKVTDGCTDYDQIDSKAVGNG